jgi:isocitrate dehydrogenase kinase/phosphatase
MRNFSDKTRRENYNTFYIHHVAQISYRLRCGTAGQATDDNIMRCVPFACCITKAKDAHWQHVIVISFFTATMVTRTRFNITLYVHCLSSKVYLFCHSSLKIFRNRSCAYII